MEENSAICEAKRNKVLLLIDWENMVISLATRFQAVDEVRLNHRIQKTIEWVKQEVGELLGEYGFAFAPGHMTIEDRRTCVNNSLRLMTCPQKEPKPKDGTGDTVDETIIWFGETMLSHPDVGFLCIVSGDIDYKPLLERAKEAGIKIALIVPTIGSISEEGGLTGFADVHPVSGKRLLLVMENL